MLKGSVLALAAVTLLLPIPSAAQETIVPDLSAMRTVSEMQAALTRAGLRGQFVNGSVAETPDRSMRVEGQQPAAGTRVPRGTTITIAIYRRPCPPMPNLVGMTLDSATGFISQCGLVVGAVELDPNPPTPEQAGRIFHQDPAAGSPLSPGATVALKGYTAYSGAPRPEASPSPGSLLGVPAGAVALCAQLPQEVHSVFNASEGSLSDITEGPQPEDFVVCRRQTMDGRIELSIRREGSAEAARNRLRSMRTQDGPIAIGEEGYVLTLRNPDGTARDERVIFAQGVFVVEVRGGPFPADVARVQPGARLVATALGQIR